MSNYILKPPYQPFTLPTHFKGIFNAEIYVGVVDSTDPKNNQLQAYAEGEDGSLTEIPQPLTTNGGGFIVYNGNPAKVVVKSAFSLIVYDKVGRQAWYEPNMSQVDPETALTQIRNDMASQLGLVYVADWFSGIVIPANSMTNKSAYWYSGQFYSVGTDNGFTSNVFDADLAAGRFVVGSKAIIKFDTVSEMINYAPIVGQCVETIGYNDISDGGGGMYLVVTLNEYLSIRGSQNVINGWDHSLSDRVLMLIVNDFADIRQAGFFNGDNPIQAIRDGLQYFNNVRMESGASYVMDVNYPNVSGLASPIVVRPGQRLIGSNTTFNLETNDLDGYQMIAILGGEVGGFNLVGDKDSHTGSTGEFGMGFACRGSVNAYVHDMNVSNCWGDGWYEGNGPDGELFTTGTRAENITIDNCRRNGWSLVTAKGLRAKNIRILNTNGTQPQSGIDIEPNGITDELSDIVIDDLYTSGNENGGVLIYLGGMTKAPITDEKKISITINNHQSVDEYSAATVTRLFYEYGDKRINGFIKINNPTATNTTYSPFLMRDWSNNHAISVELNNPTLINCVQDDSQGVLNSCAFGCYRLATDQGTDTTQGGFKITNPSIMVSGDNYGKLAALYIQADYKNLEATWSGTKGLTVNGALKYTNNVTTNTVVPPNYLQGYFEIDFSNERYETSNLIAGQTISTNAQYGNFILDRDGTQQVTIMPGLATNPPLEFTVLSVATFTPPTNGRFIYDGVTLDLNQQLVFNSSLYSMEKVKMYYAADSNTLSVTSLQKNGLLTV